MENAKERLAQAVKETEEIVYSYLPAEEGHQKTIFEAMNYSVKAGGKRLRPILMREVYRLFGGQGKEIEPLMAAIEMIHTSSLIHDDLPCVDRNEPPTEMWEMKIAEKMVPMGLELASRATEMPLKPMVGRLVEFSGFH